MITLNEAEIIQILEVAIEDYENHLNNPLCDEDKFKRGMCYHFLETIDDYNFPNKYLDIPIIRETTQSDSPNHWFTLDKEGNIQRLQLLIRALSHYKLIHHETSS